MTKLEFQQLIDDNYRVITLLGYASAIFTDVVKMKSVPENIIEGIEWFHSAVENVIYKKISPPPLPRKV